MTNKTVNIHLDKNTPQSLSHAHGRAKVATLTLNLKHVKLWVKSIQSLHLPNGFCFFQQRVRLLQRRVEIFKFSRV
ncbi:hypothetical protein Hanom_Chr11g01008341 [Helianthus anomalus]